MGCFNDLMFWDDFNRGGTEAQKNIGCAALEKIRWQETEILKMNAKDR